MFNFCVHDEFGLTLILLFAFSVQGHLIQNLLTFIFDMFVRFTSLFADNEFLSKLVTHNLGESRV